MRARKPKAVSQTHRLNRRAVLAAMVVVIGATAAYADVTPPTYYVSTSGNDSNDGLTPQTAWASTIKVDASSASFTPGTQVLFERGDVWQGTLSPQSSGIAGAPITYSAYGNSTLAKPEFLGSDVITGFTSIGNSAYAVTTPAVDAVYLNHDFLHDADLVDGTANPITYVESNPSTYYYDTNSGALYVNTGGVNINSTTITATRRPNIVDSNAQSYLTFDNLQTDETAAVNSGFGFLAQGGSNITFSNDDAFRAGKHHFDDFNSTNFLGENLNAEYTMPDQFITGGAAAYVTYGDVNGPSSQTAVWTNISASNLGDGTAFVTHGPSIAHVTVNNLVAPGFGVDLGDDVQNNAVTINGGLTGELRVGSPGTVINGTTVVNAVIYLQGTGATVENVLMYGLSPNNDYRGAIVIAGPNNTVRFSTIDTLAGTPDAAKIVLISSGGSNTTIYGNIFSGGPTAYLNNATGQQMFIYSNHNLFEFDPTFLLNYNFALSGSQWQSLMGFDMQSAIADPMFVDRADDNFSLLPGSPAIGPFTGAFWQTLNIDMFGNPRPTGATIDLGAIENVPISGITIAASADSDLGAAGAPVALNGDTLQINGTTFTSTTRPITLGNFGGVISITDPNNTFTLNSSVSGGSLSKLGPGTLVLAQPYNTTFVTIISQGILELAAPSNSTSEIFGGGTLQVDTGASLISDGIAVGTLKINGSVQIRPNGTPDGTSVLNALVLQGQAGQWTTGLDITNNPLIIEDVTNHALTLTQIKDQAKFGDSHPAGIFSSTMTGNKTLAVVDDAIWQKTFFAETNIDAGSIIVLATYIGDANLDGVVDIGDLTTVANHWQQSVSDWSQGDFDGNGIVDISDLTAIANNWQAGVGMGGEGSDFPNQPLNLLAAIQEPSPVPEPASLLLLTAPLLLLSRRRLIKA